MVDISEIDIWLRPKAAARLLGTSPQTLIRCHALWGIRMRTQPGVVGRKFNLTDMLKFQAESD